MSLWIKKFNLDDLNKSNQKTMVTYLDISFTEMTDTELVATMPVSDKVRQPFGIVHGGANCVLAETVGSFASHLAIDSSKFYAVGLNINTNHVKAVRNGVITARAMALHIGKKTHVWDIKTYNDANQLTSTTVLTMAVIARQSAEE